MRLISVFALAALLMISLSFADVGPAPPQPKITVQLVKDGQPDTSISQIYYICDAIAEPTDSPVGENTVVLPCAEGICKNDGEWFYKLNPCYDMPDGSLAYVGGDGTLKSVNISGGLTETYVIFDTGRLTVTQRAVDRVPCLPALVVFGIVGFAALRK